MAVVVVGGHSRNIGKTSLAAGLIAAFPECGWAAVKITQYGHGICSINGRACGCAAEEHRYALLEEKNREGRTDSSRFLVAGARRSLWLRTKQGQLDRAMPQLKPILETEQFVIMESNSILEFVSPDLYIVVLHFDVADFKRSARAYLHRADAAAVVQPAAHRPVWEGIALEGMPIFPVTPPTYVSEDLKEFVGLRLGRPGI